MCNLMCDFVFLLLHVISLICSVFQTATDLKQFCPLHKTHQLDSGGICMTQYGYVGGYKSPGKILWLYGIIIISAFVASQ